MIMGYIPPIRDAQAIQYGNRISPYIPGIKPISPATHAKFKEVLRKHQSEGQYVERNVKQLEKKYRNKPNLSSKINKITGKGNRFDEQI